MLGSNVEKYGADVIPRMAAIGCELGNHSYAHPNMKELSTDDGLAQFQMTDDLIAQYNNGQGATVIWWDIALLWCARPMVLLMIL